MESTFATGIWEGGRGRRRRGYFVISRPAGKPDGADGAGGRLEVLTTDPDGNGRAVAVFGFEEEAHMFLWLETAEAGWRVRRASAGELVSLLNGPCGDVWRVAFDPLPGVCGVEAGVVCRRDFVATLLGAGRGKRG